jgi:hypothetical protein
MTQLRILLATGIFALLVALSYFTFSYIKHIGYVEAEVKYTKIIEEHNKAIDAKISELEKSSRALVTLTESNNTKLTQNIGQIVLGLNGKTLTVIKDGKCVPTKEFSDSFGKLNSTVNESMKGSRK